MPAHFALPTPLAVAEAIHTRTIPERRLTELAPLVFEEADRDPVAAELLARLTTEVAAFVRAAIDRLDLGDRVPEVLLGGGLMQAGSGRLVRDTAEHLAGLGLAADVRAVSSPPIVGAALLALDDIGASAGRARASSARARPGGGAARMGRRDLGR